jgi:uncharacterized membrane protein
MTEQDDMVRDDAPITASKTIKPDAALSAETVTISRSPDELFGFWRDVRNLPRFMADVETIEPIDDKRSRWTVKAPGGQTVSWESIITHEEPGRSISWQSAEGADVDNSGRVEFIDAGQRGTVVRAVIAYRPPAGAVGKLVAKVFQREPRIQSRRNLRRFKQLMEAGEIATGARNRRLFSEQEDDQ